MLDTNLKRRSVVDAEDEKGIVYLWLRGSVVGYFLAFRMELFCFFEDISVLLLDVESRMALVGRKLVGEMQLEY